MKSVVFVAAQRCACFEMFYALVFRLIVSSGTDRNNLVELNDRGTNFPTPFEKTKLWNSVSVAWIYHDNTGISTKDLAVNLASSGYYK